MMDCLLQWTLSLWTLLWPVFGITFSCVKLCRLPLRIIIETTSLNFYLFLSRSIRRHSFIPVFIRTLVSDWGHWRFFSSSSCAVPFVQPLTVYSRTNTLYYQSLSSDRQHMSYDVFSGAKRKDYQNCSVLYRVLKLCTVISTLICAVLAVLWIGNCHIGPISLCMDLGLVAGTLG